MPPQDPAKDPREDTSKAPDPKSFLLPKKEGAPSVDSAQRINAGALLAQEEQAKQEMPEQKSGATAASSLSPAAGGPPRTFAEASPAQQGDSSIPAIETYGGDINRAVQGGNISVVGMAAAEAERRARGSYSEAVAPPGLSAEPAPPRTRWFFIAGGIILVLATLAIIAALVIPPPAPTQKEAAQAPLMSVDQTIPVPPGDGTRENLMQNLNQARQNVNLSVGLVARLFIGIPTTTGAVPDELPAQNLLAALAPGIPPALLRTLEPAHLLGVHSFDENQAFLVLRVDSYQQAYSGMLAWETSMQRDLLPLFLRSPSPRIQNAPAATSTASTSPQAATSSAPAPEAALAPAFTDRVVDNHDARVILNDAGDILLLWTFLDRNTIVITTNEYTLGEVISRLNTSSLVPQP